MNPPHTVVLIEDDSELRGLFGDMLASASGWKVAGSYARAETAMPAIEAAPPDVVIVDIQLPGISGIECVRRLKPLFPATQFLMVTVYDNADRVYEALAAGASGYLLKRDVPLRLLEALTDVLEGGSPMSSAIARKVVQHFQKFEQTAPPDHDLTSRETEVLDLLIKGLLYKEMAEQLDISIVTVRYHLNNIYRKLHVRTRTEAAVKYLGG
ncbi:MAG: response regulator transcription factor [Luteolibacter sp.]|uniref:response regulator transcription factor n=1 Tax=Luteolibacter sp. TaxID=1962973 RepID=UPI0032668718